MKTRVVLGLVVLTSLVSQCRPRSSEQSSHPFSADVALTPPLVERCPNSKAKHWGQMAMDADLMQYKLKSMGNAEVVNVAVLDTGIDMTQADAFNVVGGLQGKPGIVPGDKHPTAARAKIYMASHGAGYVGDPQKDKGGHGTMVASVIAGNEGVGIAQNVRLTVYRITQEFSDGVANVDAETAIYNACMQNRDPVGVTILNYSWGGRLDEAGFKQDEDRVEQKKLLDILAANGCLVVKAAGNDNFRAEREFNLDDPYIRVAAIDSTMELADFSTAGEITAPGADIYLFASAQQIKFVQEENRCGDAKLRRFANGTSFAAPFAAGILSQIVRALKPSPAFRDLTPPVRISLVNRIAKASEWQGTINGLRAVRIAELWSQAGNRQEAFGDNGLLFLAGLLAQTHDPVCAEPVRMCSGITKLADLNSCVRFSREQHALCGEPKIDSAVDLVDTAFKSNAFELGFMGTRLIERLHPEKEVLRKVQKTAVSSYLKRNGYYKPDYLGRMDTSKQDEILRKMPTSMIRTVVAPYLVDFVETGHNPTSFMKQISEALLGSSAVKASLKQGVDPETGEDRGSNSTLSAVVSILRTTSRLVGQPELVQLLRRELESHIESLKYFRESGSRFSGLRFDESTYLIRILDALISDRTETGNREPFLSIERDLLKVMRQNNQYYGLQTEVVPIVSERYPTRSTVFPLIRRNLGELLGMAKSGDIRLLSPVEVQFLLSERPNGFDVYEFALKVFEAVASGQGWGDRNDPELVDTVLLLTAKEESVFASRNLMPRLTGAMISSVNPELITTILFRYRLDGVLGDMNPGKWALDKNYSETRKASLTYQKHPALRLPIIQHLAAKYLGGLQAFSPGTESKDFSRYPGDYRAAYATDYFFQQSDPALRSVVVARFGFEYDDRLNMKDRPRPMILNSALIRLDSVIVNLGKAALQKQTVAFADSMLGQILDPLGGSLVAGGWYGSDLDNPIPALRSLPKDGEWRKVAEAVIKAGASSEIYYASSALQAVVENVARLGPR